MPDHDAPTQPASATQAGGRLVAHLGAILEAWEERVRRDIPSAELESTPIIIDTLPGFLEELAQALTPGHPRTTANEGSSIATEHGGERARLTLRAPEELIREYHLLRDVILETLEAEGPLAEEDRRTIGLSIDEALAASATSYFLVHQGIREQFTATLTHDLRGPLTAAKASASLILRQADQPEVVKWAARIVENIDRADRMITDVLDAISLRVGERPVLPLARCDLVAVAREAVTHLQAAHGDHFLLVGPPRVVGFWDAEALRRAIENLGINAVKYGSPDRPITITVREISGRAYISVHNFGSYVPPEERELLFRPFQRARQAQKSGRRGWGLGLTLVRGVAEAHGGSIGVDSLPERGTTFVIDIPLDARPFQSAPITH